MNNSHKTERINELRKKLEELIGEYYNLTDPKVIKVSKKLDELIYEHHKSDIKNRLSDENK